jgi:cytochrome d ubiquinol oxidase subunit I
LQLFIGDQHGLNTLEHQPLKVAAMEANWDIKGSTPLVLFAWPDQKNQKNRFEIAIPAGASLILRHDPNAAIPALNSVPPSEQPPVANVFFAFRIMVGIGLFMIGAAWLGLLLWWRRSLFQTQWYLWPAQHVWWIGFVAVIAGWFVTEQGRQPWVIYNVMRTADAISPVPGGSVATTLALFVVVYGIVFSMGIYYINRLIANGPKLPSDAPAPSGLPNRPFSSAPNEQEVRL